MQFETQPINVGDAQAILRAHALMLAEHNGYYSQDHARSLNPTAGAFVAFAAGGGGNEVQLAPGQPLPAGEIATVIWRTCAGNECAVVAVDSAAVAVRVIGRRHGIPWAYGAARGLMNLWREQGGQHSAYQTETPWADPEAAGVDPASPPDWWEARETPPVKHSEISQ